MTMAGITTTEAARMLGVTRTRIWQLIRDGKLIAIRYGKRGVLVDEESVKRRKEGR